MFKSITRHSFWIPCGLLGLYVLSAIAITFFYVSQEKIFYSWDRAVYHNWTIEVAQAFSTSPQSAWQLIQASLASDYNKLYTLPLIPFLLWGGKSRLIYILSVVLVYQIPFGLVLGKIGNQMTDKYPQATFWGTAFITLLMPSIWHATLEGYPDIGGLLLIAIALLLYFKNSRLNQWWQIPVIGFFLAASFLFRRHFAYGVISFLLALFCQLVIGEFTKKKSTPQLIRNVITITLKISLIAVSSVFWLVLISPSFFRYTLQQNHTEMYASYALSVQYIWNYYKFSYGELMWLLSGLGFGLAMGYLKSTISRQFLLLIVSLQVMNIIIWLGYLRYSGSHYTLHFVIPIILSLTCLFILIDRHPISRVRLLLFSLLIGYLCLNLAIGLTPLGEILPSQSLKPAFTKSQPPIQRSDYTEIENLLDYLKTLSHPSAPIYIAASSGMFNSNILENASQQFSSQDNQTLAWVPTPHVDSRDFYPLEGLLQSQYVVIATPFQHHLREQEQGVVKVVVDAFTQNREIAKDFERLPRQFFLQKDVVVSIYRRIQPTAIPVAIQTLDWMQAEVGDRPGSQLDWIILTQPFPSGLGRNPDNSYRVFTHPAERFPNPTTSFLYLGELSPLSAITGKVIFGNPQCIGTTLQFSAVDAQGNPLHVTQQQLTPNQDGKFSLSLPGVNARYLQMDVLNYEPSASANYCALEISHLRIQAN